MHISGPVAKPLGGQPFVDTTVLAAGLLALAVIWSGFDPRLVEGVPVWVKPAKFAASFMVHFGTLALIVAAMSAGAREGRMIALASGIMAAAFVSEMAYLFLQAARGEASHFNLSTPFHAMAYQLMGAGAVLLIGLPILVVRAAVRDEDANFGPATREGLRWGAWLSFLLTLVVAGTMSNIGRHVGVHPAGGATIPLFGWSREVGDLRPSHFLALHALQALPLLGVWLDLRGRGPFALRIAAVAWAFLTLAVFAQALAGLPLTRL